MTNQVDFFIVGAMRSGTSSLRDALANHPEINMAHGEPKFFSNPGKYNGGIEEYHSLFNWEKSYTTRGEKSPTYAISDEAPKRIYEYNNDAKIIWILRNPVKRALSHYSHSRFRTTEAISVRRAIEDRVQLEDQRSTMAYVYRSQYDKQLSTWFEYFPESQTHILILEEVLKRPEGYLEELQRFLGVERPGDITFPHTYRPQMHKILQDHQVSSNTRKRLTEILEPTVDWVEHYLGRVIPEWHRYE